MTAISNRHIGSLLVKHGLVPAECYNAQIIMALDGAMALRYDVYVTPEQLQKLSAVFAEMAAGKKAEV